ncbi:polysaccharide deacetylase family sporulation protein PdaB [Paenibacillus aurantius]|uniref:Polysaccharide deacetylase family sporulation protein PdaB n=1 Tax=Paenibacillus aurantius TaxID=2918900 RepID=A0AA96LEY8_9BACL|nr:polysaccharide deacetylase family sporulation protein PdaB [Paenibacillus aurantius]WNQ11778.1 polysaccharide deacetylase family sporulation protein PdaB [Paenibacillus aurantius]
MNFFYVMNGRRLKQYFIIAASLVFAIGIIYVEKDQVSVFSTNEPAAIYSVQTDRKVIALTFDISWGDKRAEPIIKVLEDKGVKKSTFFLSSPWSKTHPEVVDKLVKGGFEIGSHGYRHVNYTELSDEEIRAEIETAHQMLTDLTKKPPALIRLPNGDFDKRVLKIADELNYKVIQWDTDSMDWKNIGVDQIVERVVTKAHNGDIVLLHASDSSEQTHEALPRIIDQLKAQGYEFVTVSEMIHQTSVTQTPVNDQMFKNWN